MAGSLVTPTAISEDNQVRRIEALETTIRELQSSIPKSVRGIVEQITPGFPVGAVTPYTSLTPPTGWLLADGSAVSRTTYLDLFDVVGTSFGAGDGLTTFNLPDLTGRVPVGRDSGDSSFNGLGETGGAKTHTLTLAELASHAHSTPSHSHSFSGSQSHSHGHTEFFGSITGFASPGSGLTVRGDTDNFPLTTDAATVTISGTTGGAAPTTNNNGGGNAHNNLQPYIALPYIIKHYKF